MTIKAQAFLQGYLHEKTAARKPGTGTGRARRGYDTQDFGWAEQLNAAAKAVPGGLLQGLKNVSRGARGLAETAAGGIGTAGAEVLGDLEAFSDAKGITDDATNTWRDTADTMFDFTRAGAKNVGDVLGAGGSPGLFGDRGDHVTKLHNQVMDESGRNSARDKLIARGALGAGRITADGVGYIGGLGTVAAGVKGAVGAARAATGASRVPAALAGLGRGGAAFSNSSTKLTSIPQTLKTLWSPAGKVVAGVGAGTAGIVTAAEATNAFIKTYNEPWLPAEMRESLGPEQSAKVENHLRAAAGNYVKDLYTPEFLSRLLGKDPLPEAERKAGAKAFHYARRRAWDDLKKSWAGAEPMLPTGPSVGIATGKNILARRPPTTTKSDGIVLPEGITPQTLLQYRARKNSIRAVGSTGK